MIQIFRTKRVKEQNNSVRYAPESNPMILDNVRESLTELAFWTSTKLATVAVKIKSPLDSSTSRANASLDAYGFNPKHCAISERLSWRYTRMSF